MENKIRFFIVFYVVYNNFKTSFGNASVNYYGFPPKDLITKSIGSNYVASTVVITNILEVTETDYNDWNKTI